MIRRIVLDNWRAYDHLELDLSKPVTFIVAPNGVGKTSLVDAVRWATFGDLPGRGKGRAVRLGAQEATVDLSIELPSESSVNIRRTLTASGKSSFRGSTNSVEISESEYLRVLSQAWAADPSLLTKLLFGEAGTQAESAFPIRDHLAEVFGVTPFINAASAIDDRMKTLRGEVKDRRDEEGVDSASIRAAEENVQRLESLLSEAKERLTQSSTRAAEIAAVDRAAEAWKQYRAQVEDYNSRTAAVIESLSALVDVAEGDPEDLIIRAEEEARGELDGRRSEEVEARVQAAAAGSALELLSDEPDVCPTCRRPLSDRERATALQFHRTHRDDSSESIHALHETIDAAEQKLKQIKNLSRALRSARAPSPPPVPEPGREELEQVAVVQQEVVKVTEALGAAEARFNDARSRLDALKLAAEEDASLVAAYREEAVLQIAKDALNAVEANYMTERIQPLTDEVSRRWKLLFGSEGLRLDHNGSLRLQLGEEHLDLGDLSGGERVVALFVTRLLVVASATRASTLWLDEPLEHLDPRRRAAVARTLVKAAQQHALDQVIVTTYEERIAHQLAATAPNIVAVEHVRATPNY